MTDELSAVDRNALERCIAATLADDDPATVEQVQHKLRDDPWCEVGRFCAYGCQFKSLQLKLWQIPVCWLDQDKIAEIIAAGQPRDDLHEEYEAAKLGQRLIAAGKSLYEPNPITALADE